MKKYLPYYILFSLIYAGQGIYSLPAQSIFYWLKETLGLGVDKIAYIGALTTIPWCIKPLYGMISDVFPLLGYRRKSYLIINYIFITLIGLGIFFFGLTVPSLILTGIFCGIAFAMNDVCADGVMVEVGQKEKMTGKFQSVQWGAISIASLLTSLCGGLIAKYLNYQWANLFVSIFIFCILLFLIFNYKEEKRSEKINVKCFKGIKSAIKNKQLWLAILFLFFLYFSPSFGTALMFKMRDVLNFDKIFIGVLGSTGSAFGIIGAFLYYKLCKSFNLKKLLFWTTLLGALTTFCYLYYPNWQTALIYSIIFGTFGMLSQLVILDYAAQITPKEAEAFTFAGLCSIINLGSMGSAALGGFLYPKIGLDYLIIISGAFTLFCLFFIPHLKLNKN
jgi:predicted MFS family arabinose efflux permease